MSVPQGRRIVLFSLLASIALTLQTRSLPLYVAVGGSMLLGTAYSAKPMRLKRWPFAAALCIALVRCAHRSPTANGHPRPLTLFGHPRHLLTPSTRLPPPTPSAPSPRPIRAAGLSSTGDSLPTPVV